VRRPLSILVLVALVGGLMTVFAAPAGALQPPWVQTTPDWTRQIAMVCRANASTGGNQIANQNLDYKIQAPDGVVAGSSFDIVIKSGLSIFPRNQVTLNATVNVVRNLSWRWQMPTGVTINSVTAINTPGSPTDTPNSGYYVARANVPVGLTQATPDMFYPDDWDPLVDLTEAQRVAYPTGTAPTFAVDTQGTNVIKMKALGSGSGASGEYQGGSAIQVPWLKVNVTATAPVGSNLDTSVPGQTPNALPQVAPYTQAVGGQPATTFGADPTVSTNWPNATFTTNANATVLSIINASAPTACAPGYTEDNGPTPPAYMTGPGALANGVAPYISRTKVVEAVDTTPSTITITTPVNGGTYATGQVVSAAFDCNDSYGSGDDVCDADNDGNPILNGEAVDTTDGSHTFTVNAQDNAGNPSTLSYSYTVAPNTPPVASAGPDQPGKKTGNVITLDASGSSDVNTGQTLSYAWTQLSGPTASLSNASVAKPTFTVPPNVTYPHTMQFQVTVTDSMGASTSDTVDIGVTATQPTVSAITRTPSGTVYTGDTITLGATISNPDAVPLTYTWSQATGRTTSLSSNTVANPTFILPASGAAPTSTACTSGTTATGPAVANCPRFQLSVTAANGTAATANVALAAYGSSLPATPVTNAGPAQNIPNAGGLVTLAGTATQTQGHALTYAWTQTAGPAVTLSDTTVLAPTFTAPAGGASPVVRTFSLVATDTNSTITTPAGNNRVSAASTVTITVVPDHVVASAGAPQSGKVAGNVVTLDASASTDPNLASLSYSWTQTGGPIVGLSSTTVAKPTFTVPPLTAATDTITFQVDVTNGLGGPTNSDTASTTVGLVATTPTVTVSRAPSGTVFTGDVITLTANITNVDGTNPADYTYLWSQVSGRTTSLSSNTAANPTYILPASGAAPTTTACTSGTGGTADNSANCPRFQVIVTKTNTGKASTAAALAAHASSLPTRPVANAGPAQGVKVLDVVTLTGAASTQAQNHPLSYAWTQTAGTPVSLSSTTAVSPTFTAPATPGTFTFSLVVTDVNSTITATANNRASVASTVTITTNLYPATVANAGSNQTVNFLDPVTLHGSGSDPSNLPFTYSWTQTGGTPVLLSSTSVAEPTFTAPAASGTLSFQLTVSNGMPGGTNTSTTQVNVGAFLPPVANAGGDQTKLVSTTVTLDGSGSYDPNGHTDFYTWEQLSGPSVSLSNSHAVSPTFTAPSTPATLVFRLTVDDGPYLGSSFDDVTISVYNTAPVANAGASQNVASLANVTLHGSGSSDADGHTLSYTWLQVSGPAVTLSNVHAANPTFTAPYGPVSLSFQLTVDDGHSGVTSDSTSVAVAGIPGLNFKSEMAPTFKPETVKSGFNTTVTNVGTLKYQVTNAIFTASITVNGVPVPNDQIVVGSKSAQVAAGKNIIFPVTWNHGADSIRLGDDIAVTTCISAPGDEVPANNCTTWNSLINPLNASVASSLASIKKGSVKDVIKVAVINSGTARISPVRDEDVTLTVTYGSGPSHVTRTVLADPLVVGLAAGDARNFAFVWDHPKLNAGTVVTVQACVNAPNNISAFKCTTYAVTVS
jgi:hypothetical protein